MTEKKEIKEIKINLLKRNINNFMRNTGRIKLVIENHCWEGHVKLESFISQNDFITAFNGFPYDLKLRIFELFKEYGNKYNYGDKK